MGIYLLSQGAKLPLYGPLREGQVEEEEEVEEGDEHQQREPAGQARLGEDLPEGDDDEETKDQGNSDKGYLNPHLPALSPPYTTEGEGVTREYLDYGRLIL